MVRLVAKSATEGLLPVQHGGTVLTGVEPAAISCVMPQAGGDPAVFKSAVGAPFPGPNRTTGKEGARAIWTGPDQAMVVGHAIGDLKGYAVSDHSDGWTILRLDGDESETVLARLVPVDLRRHVFKRGHTARTMLGHMTVSLTRVGDRRFDIMVFRSMTRTAIHELDVAMRHCAARPNMM